MQSNKSEANPATQALVALAAERLERRRQRLNASPEQGKSAEAKAAVQSKPAELFAKDAIAKIIGSHPLPRAKHTDADGIVYWEPDEDSCKGRLDQLLCKCMKGAKIKIDCWPHDDTEFGWCLRLFRSFPPWRARMSELQSHGPEWREIAGYHTWKRLEELYSKIDEAKANVEVAEFEAKTNCEEAQSKSEAKTDREAKSSAVASRTRKRKGRVEDDKPRKRKHHQKPMSDSDSDDDVPRKRTRADSSERQDTRSKRQKTSPKKPDSDNDDDVPRQKRRRTESSDPQDASTKRQRMGKSPLEKMEEARAEFNKEMNLVIQRAVPSWKR